MKALTRQTVVVVPVQN